MNRITLLLYILTATFEIRSSELQHYDMCLNFLKSSIPQKYWSQFEDCIRKPNKSFADCYNTDYNGEYTIGDLALSPFYDAASLLTCKVKGESHIHNGPRSCAVSRLVANFLYGCRFNS
ncbi:MAG: hypothetical protein MHMPM18_002335 [Marteilia pararefringens]